MTGGTSIMDLIISRCRWYGDCGAGGCRMAIGTGSNSGYPCCMIGISMVRKVIAMTVVAVTGTNIYTAAGRGYSQKSAVGGVMAASAGIMDLTVGY